MKNICFECAKTHQIEGLEEIMCDIWRVCINYREKEECVCFIQK